MTFTLGREESLQRAQLAAQETGTRPLVGDKLETLLGATPQHLQQKRAPLKLAHDAGDIRKLHHPPILQI